MTKTYAIRGMIECMVQIPTGSIVKPYLTIPFTGGQITGYGMAPARYTTDDPTVQRLIEGSGIFDAARNGGGRIFLLRKEK